MTSDPRQNTVATPADSLVDSLVGNPGEPRKNPGEPRKPPDFGGGHRGSGVPGVIPPSKGGGITPKENPERTPVTHDRADNTGEPRNREEGGSGALARGNPTPTNPRTQNAACLPPCHAL